MPLEPWIVSPRGEIRRERVSPEETFARWDEHRQRFGETGLWPVIVPEEGIQNLKQGFEDQGESVEDHIAMGLNLDVEALFAGWLEGLSEDEEYEMDLDFDPAFLQPDTMVEDLGAITQAGVDHWIALLPCREPWEAPAVLGYGGWNACPMPAEHVAVLREWQARHDAVPLMIGSDTVQLFVPPVESREETKRIAIQQYAYCADIVDQGVGSVLELASGLIGSTVWFFWWD